MGLLSRLKVCGFRNISHLDVAFPGGVTLLTGRNGQGKSSVLEAICYLSILRSFRTHGIAELRMWDTQLSAVTGFFSAADPAYSFQLSVLQDSRRQLLVNSTRVQRASDFINRFICVPLVPEDMSIIKGPASHRRRFLDIMLSQCDDGYLASLQCYHDTLRSRNALLRSDRKVSPSVMSSFDDLLIRHGSRLECVRREYVLRLCEMLHHISDVLTGSRDQRCDAEYQCTGISKDLDWHDEKAVQDAFRIALTRSAERDQREGHTCTGPHRADIILTMCAKRIADYGSEGECRIAALSLRLASLRLIGNGVYSGHPLVVLVDDVIGELDQDRRDRFFGVIAHEAQVIVTATDVPGRMRDMAVCHYAMENGMMTQI